MAKTFRVARLNRRGREGVEAKEIDGWCTHQTSDVAISPVEVDRLAYEIDAIGYQRLVGPPVINPRDGLPNRDSGTGLGDDVFLVSRFIKYDGKQSNWPAVRFGNISVLPRENEPIDLGQKSGLPPQVAFLIEARTTPGASGSPVFQYVPGWEQRESSWDSLRRMEVEMRSPQMAQSIEEERQRRAEKFGLKVTHQSSLAPPIPPVIRLLGVAGGYMFGPDEQVVYLKGGSPKEAEFRVTRNSGMEWCVPAWKILELLNSDELRSAREEQRSTWQREISESD